MMSSWRKPRWLNIIVSFLTLYVLHSFIHSFIMSISKAPLQGDYSGALPIPVQQKREVLHKRVLLYVFNWSAYLLQLFIKNITGFKDFSCRDGWKLNPANGQCYHIGGKYASFE